MTTVATQAHDPWAMPLYSVAEAARYLGVPASTLRYWARGGVVTTPSKRMQFPQVISPDAPEGLSFRDLVELYVLNELRRVHRVSLPSIRAALEFARKELGIERLLLQDLHTFGNDVFIRHVGQAVSLSQGGQIALGTILDRHLRRVTYEDGVPTRLCPEVEGSSHPEPVFIQPQVAFGRPTVRDTGIGTVVVANRIDAGESLEDVARDYGLDPALVRDVILYQHAA